MRRRIILDIEIKDDNEENTLKASRSPSRVL